MLGLIVGLGLFLFLAPGVYWAGMFGVAIPAVVLENITVWQSLDRSSALTQGFRGRVIIVFFLTGIFAAIMKYALNAGLELLWPIIHAHLVHLTRLNLRDISSVLAMTLFGPVSAIGLTLVYYDLRMRKEAFDLMMDLMDRDARGAWRRRGGPGEAVSNNTQLSALNIQPKMNRQGREGRNGKRFRQRERRAHAGIYYHF